MNQKLLALIGGGVIVVLAYFYLDTSDSILDKTIERFEPVNWEEVHARNIVKSSIPITLLSQNGDKCTTSACLIDAILDHDYFVQNANLASDLHYDAEKETIVVACDQLKGEKSRLNIWFVTEESSTHATKYEYFITEWESAEELEP